MLKVGVQTKGILPDMPVDKGFQFIKDAGFEKVDLSIDTFLKNSDLYAGNVNRFFDASVEDLFVYFNDYRIAMEKAGISPSQMHAPYPVNVLGRGKQNEYMQGNVIPKNILIATPNIKRAKIILAYVHINCLVSFIYPLPLVD